MKHNTITVNYPGDGACTFVWNREDTVANILERTFAWFNSGSGQECDLFRARRMRSLSVNDTVCINNEWFQCKSVGWEKVTKEYVDQLEKEVVAHEKFIEHGAWYALSDIMYKRGTE